MQRESKTLMEIFNEKYPNEKLKNPFEIACAMGFLEALMMIQPSREIDIKYTELLIKASILAL